MKWRSSIRWFSHIWLHTRYESRKKILFIFTGIYHKNLAIWNFFLEIWWNLAIILHGIISWNHIFQVKIWQNFAKKQKLCYLLSSSPPPFFLPSLFFPFSSHPCTKPYFSPQCFVFVFCCLHTSLHKGKASITFFKQLSNKLMTTTSCNFLFSKAPLMMMTSYCYYS